MQKENSNVSSRKASGGFQYTHKTSLSSPKVSIGDPLLMSVTKRRRFPISPVRQALGNGPISITTKQHSGFTLIELLVVVLIIGILAAVALPQYKFAVAKARMTQLVTLGNSVKQAEERYYLANGNYTTDWTELDMDLPGEISTARLAVTATTAWVSLWDARIANNGVRLYIGFDNASPDGKQCYALQTNSLANDLCHFFTKRAIEATDGVWNVYIWNN